MKVLLVLALTIAGVVLSGLFGMLHNQISCTVAPEYFTRFKYDQFGIPETVPLRQGAAMVGFLATWWMGLIIGPLLACTALRFSETRRIGRETLLAYGVVLGIAALFSVFGLFIGFQLFPAVPPQASSSGSGLYSTLTDVPAFNRAGTMHNSSYFGGIVGAFFAWVHMLHRLRQQSVPRLHESGTQQP